MAPGELRPAGVERERHADRRDRERAVPVKRVVAELDARMLDEHGRERDRDAAEQAQDKGHCEDATSGKWKGRRVLSPAFRARSHRVTAGSPPRPESRTGPD